MALTPQVHILHEARLPNTPHTELWVQVPGIALGFTVKCYRRIFAIYIDILLLPVLEREVNSCFQKSLY